jgi:hypothetical protein
VGEHERPGNKDRLLLAEQVMIWAREMVCAHLLVFPAGFLCATDLAEARALVEPVIANLEVSVPPAGASGRTSTP